MLHSWRSYSWSGCSPWRACLYSPGFISKFYLFNAAASQGLLWLAGLAIFTSLISLYYYLNILRQIYIEPAEDRAPHAHSQIDPGVLGILLAAMVFLGVYPAPLLDVIQHASDAILSSEGVMRFAGR